MGLLKHFSRLADFALSKFDSGVEPCAVVPNDHQFFWGMRNLPLEVATHHMGVLGTTGSGKTTIARLLAATGGWAPSSDLGAGLRRTHRRLLASLYETPPPVEEKTEPSPREAREPRPPREKNPPRKRNGSPRT